MCRGLEEGVRKEKGLQHQHLQRNNNTEAPFTAKSKQSREAKLIVIIVIKCADM